jgi:hypothetical protein
MKVLLTILALALPTLSMAKVSYDKETSTLRITGQTDMVQVIAASNMIREEDIKYVEMWGPGGYMEMGLQLGNHISKIEGVTVVVPKGKRCISACAFAAMGSKHLRIDGKLMLHRPFIVAAPITVPLEDILAHMGKGYLKTAYYLEDHGYSRHVMNNIMDYTSPCKFMVYEGIEVKNPSDLVRWSLDDSRCEMMKTRIQR